MSIYSIVQVTTSICMLKYEGMKYTAFLKSTKCHKYTEYILTLTLTQNNRCIGFILKL